MKVGDKVILHPDLENAGEAIDGISIAPKMLFDGVKTISEVLEDNRVKIRTMEPWIYPMKALLPVPVFKEGMIVLKIAGEDTGSMVQIVDVSENKYTANEFGEDECEYSYKDMNGNIKTHKISLGFQFPPLDRSSNQIYRHDIEPINGIVADSGFKVGDKVIFNPNVHIGDIINGYAIPEDMIFIGVKEIVGVSESPGYVLVKVKESFVVYPIKVLLKVPLFKVGDTVTLNRSPNMGEEVAITAVKAGYYTPQLLGQDGCLYDYKCEGMKIRRDSSYFKLPSVSMDNHVKESNRKFNVGDKVLLNPDLEIHKEYGGKALYPYMVQGGVMEIRSVGPNGTYEVGKVGFHFSYYYTKEMLLPAPLYKVGDLVKVTVSKYKEHHHKVPKDYEGRTFRIEKVNRDAFTASRIKEDGSEYILEGVPEVIFTSTMLDLDENTAIVPNNNNKSSNSHEVRLQEQESHFIRGSRQQTGAVRCGGILPRVIIKHLGHSQGDCEDQESSC